MNIDVDVSDLLKKAKNSLEAAESLFKTCWRGFWSIVTVATLSLIMKDFVLCSFRWQIVTWRRRFVKIRKHMYQTSRLPTPRTQSF